MLALLALAEPFAVLAISLPPRGSRPELTSPPLTAIFGASGSPATMPNWGLNPTSELNLDCEPSKSPLQPRASLTSFASLQTASSSPDSSIRLGYHCIPFSLFSHSFGPSERRMSAVRRFSRSGGILHHRSEMHRITSALFGFLPQHLPAPQRPSASPTRAPAPIRSAAPPRSASFAVQLVVVRGRAFPLWRGRRGWWSGSDQWGKPRG